MSKVRVHELAKELGVSSKDVLAKLAELGEFVKSASSTVEAPVIRKLKEAMPALEAPVKKVAAKNVVIVHVNVIHKKKLQKKDVITAV